MSLHSLQLGAKTMPSPSVIDLMDGVTDFADTAARIAGLDLVISVDTAVAHVAATMGKPVWMLSRFQGCWRWMLDRADTPWYPTHADLPAGGAWRLGPGDPPRARRSRPARRRARGDHEFGRLSCRPERLQCATSSPFWL